jgi:hypothetical protein
MWQSQVENVHYSILVKFEFLTSIDLLIHPISAVKTLATPGDCTLSYASIFAVTFALKIASADRDPAPRDDIADRAT